MSELVLFEQQGDVAWLTMNRPEVRNALSREHVAAIRDAIERATEVEGIRVIVLAGSDPVFCAGADVNQYRQVSDPDQVRDDGARLMDLLDYMMRCELPIVARVQGAAFGGAMGLTCASDVVVAAEGTRFSLSEARLGIVPAVISHAVVTALGPRHARQLMLRSEPFSAEEALAIGLAQDVVPEQELDAAVTQMANQLRKGAPGALTEIKRLIHTLSLGELSRDEEREMILAIAAERRTSNEGQEGLNAFLEKRPPAWDRARMSN
ncbi:MAG: enoyl-CoA hydratase-related protein [Chloroflexota bacterium]